MPVTKRKTPAPAETVAAVIAPPPPPLNPGHRIMRSPDDLRKLQDFARRLHQLMLAKGLSQSDLARAVWGKDVDGRGYDVAKNRDRISQYLKGISLPAPANMARLAKELGVTVIELAPDAVVAAVDREHPALRMTMIAGHTDKTHLQVDQLVDPDIAVKIAALLSENENRTRHG